MSDAMSVLVDCSKAIAEQRLNRVTLSEAFPSASFERFANVIDRGLAILPLHHVNDSCGRSDFYEQRCFLNARCLLVCWLSETLVNNRRVCGELNLVKVHDFAVDY